MREARATAGFAPPKQGRSAAAGLALLEQGLVVPAGLELLGQGTIGGLRRWNRAVNLILREGKSNKILENNQNKNK